MAEEIALKPGVLKWVFTFVLVLGVAFYFAWGFAYNALFDLANYTASAILIFTGLFGMLLYRELEREEAGGAAAR
ncbi:MAG TPA: hypothetical protein VGB42_07435 [Candidatus Thermoplasmatota archaeon]